ncbi:hypothetical protein D3C73_982580 [compost metagenome]
MFKVFVEYAINVTERENYIKYMQQWQEREGRLEWLEGTDQPELFVEIWNDMNYEEYISFKEQRLTGHAETDANWDEWIRGGLVKLHIWHFTKVG